MKKDVQAFWKWVQNRMDYLGIYSIAELERRSQVSGGPINKRKNGLKFPTVEMAEGMCRALRVSWIELWTHAGFVDRVEKDQLTGLNLKIYEVLQETGEDFKRTVLKTIKIWLVLYEELKGGQTTLH